MDFLLLAFILGLIIVASGVGLMALGIHVVKTYPNPSDPARNAKRFTRPAGILLAVGIGATVAFLVAVILTITT